MENKNMVRCYTDWLEKRLESKEYEEIDNMDKSELVNDFLSEVRKSLLEMYEN